MLYLEKPKDFVPDLIAVGCLVFWKGEILLLKRRPDDPLYPGLWGFPSGKVEPEETPSGAMFRELREETGIRADVFDVLGECYIIYPELQFVYHMYRFDFEEWIFLEHPEIRLNPLEHTDFRFESPAGIISMEGAMLDVDSCVRHFYKP